MRSVPLRHLLYNKPVPVADLAVFLYRDFGVVAETPANDDLLHCFAMEFGYARRGDVALSEEFRILFRVESAGEGDDTWLEAPPPGVGDPHAQAEANGIQLLRTAEPIRQLTAEELLTSREESDHDGPSLQELRVEGLLSFSEETTLNFGRLNLLVGPNGSGKSNLIDCLRVLVYAPRDIQRAFANGGFEAWLHNALDKDSSSARLQATVRVPGSIEAVRHEMRLGPASHSRAQIEELITTARTEPGETTPLFVGSYRSAATISVAGPGRRRREKRLDPKSYNPFQSILSQVRDVGQYPEITRLADLYSSIRVYSEWSFGRGSKLREAAPAGRSDASLSESMDDLPVALNALEQTTAHEKLLKLLPELKETYRDYVTRILFGRVGLELVEAPFKLPVPASRLSDGTLRFLAMAAILLQPTPPPVICIEEPELGMHPDMIRMVSRNDC